MSLDTLIVDGDALKRALGIDLEDTDSDDLLSQLEAAAVAIVEGETHRRFQPPDERVEIREGSGTRTLYLNGHVDDPDASVAVRVRSRRGGDWDALVDGTDYERRRDTLVRLDGGVWAPWSDYELTYDDGYTTAPADIQALIIEIVGIARASSTTSASVSSGTGGLTSETIGEFSQTFDVGAAAAATTSATSLGSVGLSTLNRWRRVRV